MYLAFVQVLNFCSASGGNFNVGNFIEQVLQLSLGGYKNYISTYTFFSRRIKTEKYKCLIYTFKEGNKKNG